MPSFKFSCAIICLTLWACKNTGDQSLENLRDEINRQFEEVEGDFALAFIDLQNAGETLLINENDEFHAASTMKVPVMIELFKRAGSGEFELTDSIIVKNEFKSIVDQSLYNLDTADDSEKELYKIVGERRSIYDLNYDMIIWSSNLATNILIELANAKKVTATMRELGAVKIQVLRGVEDQKAYDQGLSNSTTALDLLKIFEAIARGSHGLQDYREEMIKILKDQRFNEIIPALLPEDVEVAHKTGVITALHHDAGIIYLPDGRSYVLVLLSKNLGDFDEGTKFMAQVSRMIYDYMMNNR